MSNPLSHQSALRRYREARVASCSRRDALGVALLAACPVCADRGVDALGDPCSCRAGDRERERERLRGALEEVAALRHDPEGSVASMRLGRALAIAREVLSG